MCKLELYPASEANPKYSRVGFNKIIINSQHAELQVLQDRYKIQTHL